MENWNEAIALLPKAGGRLIFAADAEGAEYQDEQCDPVCLFGDAEVAVTYLRGVIALDGGK